MQYILPNPSDTLWFNQVELFVFQEYSVFWAALF